MSLLPKSASLKILHSAQDLLTHALALCFRILPKLKKALVLALFYMLHVTFVFDRAVKSMLADKQIQDSDSKFNQVWSSTSGCLHGILDIHHCRMEMGSQCQMCSDLSTSADMITIRSFLMTNDIWKVLGSVLRHIGQITSPQCSAVFLLWWSQRVVVSYGIMYWVYVCPFVSPEQAGLKTSRQCFRADRMLCVTVVCITYIM